MVRITDFLRIVVKLGGGLAIVAAASAATGCVSIPARAWQNGRALSAGEIIYGDRSFNGRAAYRAYLSASALGLQVSPPNPFLPPPSRMYP